MIVRKNPYTESPDLPRYNKGAPDMDMGEFFFTRPNQTHQFWLRDSLVVIALDQRPQGRGFESRWLRAVA